MIMKTYIYKAEDMSCKRGYNRTVSVYRVKNNVPQYIGYDDEISTASYKGDKAIASILISKIDGHKMKNGYDLASKNIQIFEL